MEGQNNGAESVPPSPSPPVGPSDAGTGDDKKDGPKNTEELRVDAVERWKASLRDIRDSSDYTIEKVLAHVPVGTRLQPKLNRTAVSAMSSQETIKDEDVVYVWSRGPTFASVRDATKPFDIREMDPSTQWYRLSESTEYVTTDADCMHILRVEAVRKSDGQRVQQRSIHVLPPPPATAPIRKMVPVQTATGSANPTGQAIRVMTYNILCKTYADFKQYPYTPQYAVEWEYRKKLLLKEMTKDYVADIICLQECEKEDYDSTFLPALTEFGFSGDFQKRPGIKLDGCAVFFNNQKFKYMESHCVNFDVLEEDPMIKPVRRTYTFRTNNIASVVLLERLPFGDEKITEDQRYLWVACGHLFWNPSVPTVKLLQAKFLLDEVRRFQSAFYKRQQFQASGKPIIDVSVTSKPINSIGVSNMSSPLLTFTRHTGPAMPLIFCGDLNSTPESAVYAIIKNGSVPKQDLAARKFPLLDWQQPFRHLRSAYESVGEPQTNITESFTGCLDYIWYDSSNMMVIKLLQNPTQDPVADANIKEYGFLPSPSHPSDHLPLMAEISFIPSK